MQQKINNYRAILRTSLVMLAGLLGANCAQSAPLNIIYIVGDGMGAPYVSGYRYFKHGDNQSSANQSSINQSSTNQSSSNALPVATTRFDQMLVGTARTYPHDDTYVTDSAAAATALASGHKTYNGAIGVDAQQKPLQSVLARARAQNYATAMIVTSAVTHATPASFAAHVSSRNDAAAIADQYFDTQINGKPMVDVLLGGGLQYFARAERNLVDAFARAGYHTPQDLSQLAEVPALPVLGLFAADGLPFALGSDHPHRLAQMVKEGLRLLQPHPFFMLIEASQIDWCGHANDIACAMAEMDDLHQTLGIIDEFVARHPNTLVVMTADHNTGGLTLGANNEYAWHSDLIGAIKYPGGQLATRLIKAAEQWPAQWQRDTQLPLTSAQTAALDKQVKAKQADALAADILRIINVVTATGWTSHGHTGEDVLVFAKGPGAAQFRGNLNNTDIARELQKLLP